MLNLERIAQAIARHPRHPGLRKLAAALDTYQPSPGGQVTPRARLRRLAGDPARRFPRPSATSSSTVAGRSISTGRPNRLAVELDGRPYHRCRPTRSATGSRTCGCSARPSPSSASPSFASSTTFPASRPTCVTSSLLTERREPPIHSAGCPTSNPQPATTRPRWSRGSSRSGWNPGCFTPTPRARRRRTTRSRSRRPTSPACCTWATRSTTRSRTPWPAITGCAAGGRSGSSAPTTPASPPRPRSSARCSPRAPAAPRSAARSSCERVWEWRDQYGGDDHRPAQAPRRLLRLRDGALHARRRLRAGRAARCSWPCTRRATSTATATWSTGTRAQGSAISDLEVEQREVTDTLYYIDYPLASGSGAITVATVRPETMLADTAIAVHPEDERYRRLIGEKAILPLVGRKLRIIADEYVKPEFGTGRAEDHPRARSQRLRDRPPPRPRPAVGDRRGRPHHRRGARALPRADGRRGAARGRRRAAASRG